VALVLARAENGVIGRDGGLPWRLSRDLKRFREITMGKPVIMGRKTFQSIGRALPGRDNIVVSRDPGFEAAGCRVAASLDAAFALAEDGAGASGSAEICVIGGAEIYAAALARAHRVYLTEVHMDADGDAAMQVFPVADWEEVSRVRHEPEGDDSAAFSFVILERRGARQG
jgi:dihydrofolate reductase